MPAPCTQHCTCPSLLCFLLDYIVRTLLNTVQLKCFFQSSLYNQTKKVSQKECGALLPPQCIKRAVFTVKITLHQNPNQTHECASVHDFYLWVHCESAQASCLPYDSLQHFRWGYACHVEATSLHCVPELICFISVFENDDLIFATP